MRFTEADNAITTTTVFVPENSPTIGVDVLGHPPKV
jgi:hypothetical protein